MSSALFSDMEGTLTMGSAPRMFIQVGQKLGIFSKGEVLKMVIINLLSKPFPRSSALRSKIFYFAICDLVKGHTIAEAEHIAEVMSEELFQQIKPSSLERIREHQQAGRPVVVVSAGGHESIVAFARKLGATRGEGTKLEHKNGVFTGRGEGLCQGTNKALRVQQVAREMGYNLAECYGYGDTRADVAFLELLRHPAVVDPEAKLKIEAQKRAWPIIQTNASVSQAVK